MHSQSGLFTGSGGESVFRLNGRFHRHSLWQALFQSVASGISKLRYGDSLFSSPNITWPSEATFEFRKDRELVSEDSPATRLSHSCFLIRKGDRTSSNSSDEHLALTVRQVWFSWLGTYCWVSHGSSPNRSASWALYRFTISNQQRSRLSVWSRSYSMDVRHG